MENDETKDKFPDPRLARLHCNMHEAKPLHLKNGLSPNLSLLGRADLKRLYRKIPNCNTVVLLYVCFTMTDLLPLSGPMDILYP